VYYRSNRVVHFSRKKGKKREKAPQENSGKLKSDFEGGEGGTKGHLARGALVDYWRGEGGGGGGGRSLIHGCQPLGLMGEQSNQFARL